MVKKPNRNTEGLKKSAKERNQETIEKVNKAIDKLKRSKTKEINPTNVAKEAGVSKATIYNNDILIERIKSLMALKKISAEGDTMAPPKSKMQAKDEKIKRLYDKVKQLEKDKENLVSQLIGEHELKKNIGELKSINLRLKEKLDKIDIYKER
jgi:DNA-directed RNA polymerase specialized sigma subunit